MKSTHQLVASLLAVFVLSACSDDPAQLRQAKGDFEYLNTPELSAWHTLDQSQPQFYENYKIPQGNFTGGVGESVDIRPPQQILALIPGVRSELHDGEVTLWMANQVEADHVWETVITTLKTHHIGLKTQTEEGIETDWVAWDTFDEDRRLEGRYAMTRLVLNGRYAIKMTLTDWRENGQKSPISVTNQERYSALMANWVTTSYDQEQRDKAERLAQQRVNMIPISMGSDRSGFPVIIARSSYDTLWPRLPSLLSQMGFTVEKRSQSQGTIKVKYVQPDDEFWSQTAIEPIDLSVGQYTFQLGDLENRTSINVTDLTGKPIDESLLKTLSSMLAAVIEHDHASIEK